MESPSCDPHTAISVRSGDCLNSLSRLVRRIIRVLTASPNVHCVVRVLIEKAEGVVVKTATAEVAKGAQRENLVHVLRRWVVIVKNRGVDFLLHLRSRLVIFRGVAQRIPQGISIQ